MLDRVAVVGAWLLQELFEMVVVALSLARSVGRCDRVGVGATISLLFLFSNIVEGPSSCSTCLAFSMVRASLKTAPTASSPEAWFVAMSRSSRVVHGFRHPSL
jgi:hypothetical protein